MAKPSLRVGGRAIADRLLEVLAPLFARVIAVANDAAPWRALGVDVVADRVPGAGPLAGVEAALAAAPDGCDAVVCVAGDLPFVAPALLAALRDRAPGADAVAPRRGGYAEPLCARYARRLQPAIVARLAAGERALHALLAAVAVDWIDDDALRALDPDGLSFFNVNTPDDLARADAIAGRR